MMSFGPERFEIPLAEVRRMGDVLVRRINNIDSARLFLLCTRVLPKLSAGEERVASPCGNWHLCYCAAPLPAINDGDCYAVGVALSTIEHYLLDIKRDLSGWLLVRFATAGAEGFRLEYTIKTAERGLEF